MVRRRMTLADRHHDLVIIDETGRKVGQLRVDHTPEGLARLVNFLRDVAPLDQIACIVETIHGLRVLDLAGSRSRFVSSQPQNR